MSHIRKSYSSPIVHRSQTDSIVEFDVYYDEAGERRAIAWESLRIGRAASGDPVANAGDIIISDRGGDSVTIPAEILPMWLAEIDRLMSGDDQAPFEPVSASAHVVAAEPAPITGIVPTGASL